MTGILITTDQLRKFIPDTAEDDTTLQMRIDDNEAEISRRFGSLTLDDAAIASVTETLHGRGLTLLWLSQPADPDGEITVTDTLGTTTTELEPTDFRIRGQYLERAASMRWGDRTVVTYVPVDARGERRRVLVKLIQLDMNYQPGMGSQAGGPWSESYSSYLKEREEIFATLGQEQELFA